MANATLNGLELYYETHGSGRPLVLLHGGLMTIDLNLGRCSNRSLRAGIALLDHLGIDEADVFGFSLGGLVSTRSQLAERATRGAPRDHACRRPAPVS
jgi:pimeloyl-ACP methyl ester carboxylesterase